MKKFLLTIAFILGTVGIFAQETREKYEVYNFKADAFIYMFRDTNGKWTGWAEWEDSYTRIKIDLNKDLIIIQTVPVMKLKIQSVRKLRHHAYIFEVIDKTGESCKVRLIENKDGILQLGVSYPNLQYIYNLIELE